MPENYEPNLERTFEDGEVTILSTNPFALDPRTSPPYTEFIRETMSEHPGPRFILDLTNCTHTDSAGMRVFADTHARAIRNEDEKYIALKIGKNRDLLKLLKITGLFDHIEVDFDGGS